MPRHPDDDDARNNWWGTTSGTTIRQRIWDFNDDYTIGTVLYSPVLTQPSTIAPAYVRAITLTPESPVGIQTVLFSVELSREMDPGLFPLLRFSDSQGETFTNLEQGLCGSNIRHMASDALHNVWISTNNGGSCRHSVDGSWVYYPFGAEFVFPDNQGGAWFASWDAGAIMYCQMVQSRSVRPVPNIIWAGKDYQGNIGLQKCRCRAA